MIIVDVEWIAKSVVVDAITVVDSEMKTVVEVNLDEDAEKWFSLGE